MNPPQMWCPRCGADRTVPNCDPIGACRCGETSRCSWKPNITFGVAATATYDEVRAPLPTHLRLLEGGAA